MTHAVALLGGVGRVGWRAAWQTRKLTKDRTRRRLADGITRALNEAESTRPAIAAAIPVQRRAVLGCRAEMLELAERLRAPGPVYAQGVALAQTLLTNASSPLYRSGDDLRAHVDAALAALDGHLE
jgi:hypothetical protein